MKAGDCNQSGSEGTLQAADNTLSGPEGNLQVTDNIELETDRTLLGEPDCTLLAPPVTSVATAETESTTEATNTTTPVATSETESTTEATNSTMPVAAATTETTRESIDTTRIFDISEIIYIKIE